MSTVNVTDTLPPELADRVLALAEEALEADGVAALSEQPLLRVRHGAPAGSVRFHVLTDEGEVVGAGVVERAGEEPDSGELVVAPAHRRKGHGAALLRSLHEDAGTNGVRVWAHGRLPGAVALAASAGWDTARELHKLRMPLRDLTADERGGPWTAPELPEATVRPEIADRITVRPFEVGRDDQAWLRTNARAFAEHPEQGRLTQEDLRQRQEEDWFDPAGFFLAVTEQGDVAAFHWTKVHSDGAGLTDGEAAGEVYAVGVDPDWQGTGLGRTLTLAGLHHLRDSGLPWVHLYVDGGNTAAVRLYETLGFSVWETDVMYAPGV